MSLEPRILDHIHRLLIVNGFEYAAAENVTVE